MATDIRSEIDYPSCDGKPMADNTLQYQWMVTIKEGLEACLPVEPSVFVASDLLWYPVEGEPTINMAPDVLVAIGRPKGHRMSYKQWEEGGIAPQVVFEILSASNDQWEMADKLDAYDTYGVEEYYVYDPHRNRLMGYHRKGTVFRRIRAMPGWVSPRLRSRFEVGDTLAIFGPDGEQFLTYQELHEQRQKERARAAQEKQRADRAEGRVEQLLEKLRQQGIDPSAASL